MALELPDFWTLSGLVLALLALVTGVISVPSASRIEFVVSRACAVAAAILFFIKTTLWGADDLTLTRGVLVACFGAIVALALTLALQWINRKQEHITKGPTVPRISVDCRQQILPLAVPANETIEVLSLFPTPVENGGRGLATQYNGSGQPWKWPVNDPLEAAFFSAYRCEVTNYGDAPVFDLQMMLDLSFFESEAVPDQSNTRRQGKLKLHREWAVQSSKIDPGSERAFRFYLINNNPDLFVSARIPKTATLRMFDSEQNSGTNLTVTELGGAFPLLFTPHFESEKREAKTEGTFRVDFSDEVNGGAAPSPYISTNLIGVAGGLLDSFISKHSFGFKVTNKQAASAKEIEVFAVRIKYGNQPPEGIRVLLPQISSGASTLHPEDSAFYRLLEYLDEKPSGLSVEHVAPEKLEELRFMSRRGWSVPLPYGAAAFAIPVLNGYGIQKPVKEGDIIYVDIAVFAADLKPTYARFSINGPEPATVRLITQGSSLPD